MRRIKGIKLKLKIAKKKLARINKKKMYDDVLQIGRIKKNSQLWSTKDLRV